jgi:sterol desaturase/sphingolipid hydroxylase (fatty acid hydroxylase superfamily)
MARKPYPSIRVFQSPYLEALTHVHPITPLVFWVPVIAFLLYRSVNVHEFGWVAIASMAISGLFVWTLAEYLLHRYVFHYEGTHPITKRLHFLIHGLHHDDPNDPTRLVMPPAGGALIAFPLYLGFRAVLGPAWVDPFFAFFLVGYLCYDYIHFATHHFRPRTRVGKFLKQHHMLHHFAEHGSRWGVSSPMWDYVFGTLEEDRPVRQNT